MTRIGYCAEFSASNVNGSDKTKLQRKLLARLAHENDVRLRVLAKNSQHFAVRRPGKVHMKNPGLEVRDLSARWASEWLKPQIRRPSLRNRVRQRLSIWSEPDVSGNARVGLQGTARRIRKGTQSSNFDYGLACPALEQERQLLAVRRNSGHWGGYESVWNGGSRHYLRLSSVRRDAQDAAA